MGHLYFFSSHALIPPMTDRQPSLQSFFAAVLHTQARLPSLEALEDNLLGIGDFLLGHQHPATETI